VDLGRKLWLAHRALGGTHVKGRKKLSLDKNNLSGDKKIGDFVEAVGIPSKTFYRFIERIDTMIEEGVDVMSLPSDMKLVEAAAPKSQAVVELEEKIAKQETAIKNRDRTLTEFKEDLNKEHNKLETSRKTIRELKKEANKQSEPDPELLKRIENLQKQEENLTDQVDWYSTAAAFKTELQALLNTFDTVSSLGKRVLQTKKPIS